MSENAYPLLTPVRSSDLSAVGYSKWTRVLVIEFRSGGVYEYFAVPHAEFVALVNATSVGKYFHAQIKNQYSYRRIL